MTNGPSTSSSAARRASPRPGWPSASSTSRPRVQKVCEEVVLRMVRHIHEETGLDEPVHGGRRRAQLRGQRPRHPRDAVQGRSSCSRPRATRAARSGVAHYIYNTVLKQRRATWAWTHAYLGPEYSDAEIRALPRRQRHRLPGRSPTTSCSTRTAQPDRREATSSAGSRGAWSSARARSAGAASWPTRATRRCATRST